MSLAAARELGLSPADHLPLDTVDEAQRSAAEVAKRACALHAVLYALNGVDIELVSDWLASNGLDDQLWSKERRLLDGEALGEISRAELLWQLESQWVLAWVLGLGRSSLDWRDHCPNDLASLCPDPRTGSAGDFIAQASLRNGEEIAVQRHVAFLLQWQEVAARLEGYKPLPLDIEQPRLVRERRRALLWCTSRESWDEITLDT